MKVLIIAATGVQRPAVERDALAHSPEAIPSAVGIRRPAPAVVGDLEIEFTGPVPDADLGVRGPGVPQ